MPSVDIIDLEYYTRSGDIAWHTKDDTLDNVSARSLQAVGDVLLARAAGDREGPRAQVAGLRQRLQTSGFA